MKSQVISTQGLPGSGKSTWVKKFLQNQTDDWVVIHPDSIRLELTGNIEDQSKNAEVFKLAFQRMEDALKSGKNVIFDACSQSRERRKPIIALAKKYNAEVHSQVFAVPLSLAKERNAKRDRVVPNFVLERMYSQWEDPSIDEGFDFISIQQ